VPVSNSDQDTGFLRFLLVFVVPSSLIPVYYLHQATPVSFHILSIASFIKPPSIDSMYLKNKIGHVRVTQHCGGFA
jgi:hypothetical protein